MNRFTSFTYLFFVSILMISLTYFHGDLRLLIENYLGRPVDIHQILASINILLLSVSLIVFSVEYMVGYLDLLKDILVLFLHPCDTWLKFGHIYNNGHSHHRHQAKKTRVIYKNSKLKRH